MSTVKTNTLTGTSTAGSIAVTGEGGSTTTNLQQGLAKGWVGSVTDSSQSIAGDSFNVSGFTDIGLGNSNHSLTNNMNTGANTYSVQNTAAGQYPYQGIANSSSEFKLRTVNSSGGSADGVKNGTIHGDLA